MHKFLFNIIQTYLHIYQYSIIISCCVIFFCLGYVDRIHLRERCRLIGSFISYKIKKLMINESLYDKFRIILLRSTSIFFELLCGFCEGLENFKPIISIKYSLPYKEKISDIEKNISSDLQTITTQSIATQSIATQTNDFIDSKPANNDLHRVVISTKDSDKIFQKICKIIDNESPIIFSDTELLNKKLFVDNIIVCLDRAEKIE